MSTSIKIKPMSTSIKIEITQETLKRLVREYLSYKLNVELDEEDIEIQTKSDQNYKSEWEKASFKAVVCKYISED